MVLVTIYGQGYQSPSDGGDIESNLPLSDEELKEIESTAKELDMEVDELSAISGGVTKLPIMNMKDAGITC